MYNYLIGYFKMRLQFTIDNDLGGELQNRAHELGFSVSSYVRYLVKTSLESKTKTNVLDKAIKEPAELISLDEFKKQLGVNK